jgi:hypothetical protein
VPSLRRRQVSAVRVPRAGSLRRGRNGPRHKAQPFRLLENPYRTQGQFNRAVKQRARLSYGPALNDIEGQRREEESAHRGRRQDIQRYFGGMEDSLRSSYEESSKALNQLIATREDTSRAARSGLEAALNASEAAAKERAASLGIEPSEGLGQGLKAAGVAAEEGRANTLAGSIAAMIEGSSQRRSLAPLGALAATRRENSRSENVLSNLRSQRRRVVGEIPGYEETSREQLYQQLLAQQNQGFQQQIAGRQFGLQREQFGLERERFGLEQNKFQHQSRIDWANVQINRAQLVNERERIEAEIKNARDARSQEAAKAKAKRWDNASNWLASYLAPSDSEIIRNSNEGRRTVRIKHGAYRRDYQHAYRILTVQFQLEPRLAYRLISTVSLPGWRKRALHDWGYRSKGKGNEPKQLSGPPVPDNLR